MNIYIILEVLSLKLLVFNDLPRHIFKRFYPHLRKTYNLEKEEILGKVPLLRIFSPDTLLHQEKRMSVFLPIHKTYHIMRRN